MGKLDSFYQGWRSEAFGELMLSNISFTVPVSVRSDVGVDFFCTLYNIEETTKQKYLTPRSTFAVQIKSKDNVVTLSKSNVDYLSGLEIPYFLCIVDRNNMSLGVFSTQQISHIFQKYGNPARFASDFCIELKPVEKYSDENKENNLLKIIADKYSSNESFEDLLKDAANPNVKTNPGSNLKTICLEVGPLIGSLKISDLEDKEFRKKQISNFSEWIDLEYFNKYNIQSYIPHPAARWYFGEELKIKPNIVRYYHPQNYENTVYSRISSRLAMLFLHLTKTRQKLIDPNNVSGFIDLVLAKNSHLKDKEDLFSKWAYDCNLDLEACFENYKKFYSS